MRKSLLAFSLSVAFLAGQSSFLVAGVPSSTQDIQVAASADDAEEGVTGAVKTTSGDLEFVFAAGGNQTVGMRFRNLLVPEGATILAAWVQLTVEEATSVATSLTIWGQDADNPAAFTTAAGNVTARPKTTAAVGWVPPVWNSVGAAGLGQRTPDLSSIVQEIVNRPGWSANQALVILASGTGERVATSYDENPNEAPVLHVEWTDCLTNSDGDGVCDDVDNCPDDANQDQADLDGDGLGDVCDPDADGDGALAGVDCDDLNPARFPGNAEIACNGVDDDCNATTADCPVSSGLGPRQTVGSGFDPDVAVGFDGALHVVYARASNTYYRKVTYPSSVGSEYLVGAGTDPQIVVDSNNVPHVVMGALRYSRWNGSGFTTPLVLASDNRKPRIAVDSQNRIYVTIERVAYPRVRLWVISNGSVIAGPVTVGTDNNGGIDIDGDDVAQISWRSSKVYYNTYSIAGGAGTSAVLQPSSDFSWIAVDLRDDTVHLVNTVSGGGGIQYRHRNGNWSAVVTTGQSQVAGAATPDDVGPTIDIDVSGRKFVAFSGGGQVPYYFIVSPTNAVGQVYPLDPEGGSLAGGKFRNPNIGAHPDRNGAFAAWGTSTVYVRGIGL